MQRSCICDAEPHLTHYMLDLGGCGYNNFEYVSITKLKEIVVWRGHTLRLEEEGSGNSSMSELWKWNLITVKLEF